MTWHDLAPIANFLLLAGAVIIFGAVAIIIAKAGKDK